MSRTYVITGSASGIGAATSALLQDQGHRVVGIDLREADVQADLSTTDGRRAAADGALEQSEGRIDPSSPAPASLRRPWPPCP